MKCECGGEFFNESGSLFCDKCGQVCQINYVVYRCEKAEALLAYRDKQLVETENELAETQMLYAISARKLEALQSRVDGLTMESLIFLWELELGYSKNDCHNGMIKEHGFVLDCEKCQTGCHANIGRFFSAILTLLKEVK